MQADRVVADNEAAKTVRNNYFMLYLCDDNFILRLAPRLRRGALQLFMCENRGVQSKRARYRRGSDGKKRTFSIEGSEVKGYNKKILEKADIMLTAMDSIAQIAQGTEAGADDTNSAAK